MGICFAQHRLLIVSVTAQPSRNPTGLNASRDTISRDSGIESAKNRPYHAAGIVGSTETAAVVTHERRTTGDCVGMTDAADGRILEGLCLPGGTGQFALHNWRVRVRFSGVAEAAEEGI